MPRPGAARPRRAKARSSPSSSPARSRRRTGSRISAVLRPRRDRRGRHAAALTLGRRRRAARRRRNRRVPPRQRLAELPLQAGQHPLHRGLPRALVSRSARRFLALDPATPAEQVVLELDARGGRTLYLPDASVTIPPAPLFRPHLRRIGIYGFSRGIAVRRRGVSASRVSSSARSPCCSGPFRVASRARRRDGGLARRLGALSGCRALAAFFGGLRFRSARVGALVAPGLVLTHFVYSVLFVSGLVRRTRG